MENLTNNPGLQHLAEEIFYSLNIESLENCFEVNRLWREILNPSFWLKKCEKYKGEFNYQTWTEVWQVTKNTIFEKELGRKLKKIYKLLETSTIHNLKLEDDPINWAAFYGHEVAIKSLINLYPQLMHTPNKFGMTPIHMAASMGHAGVVQMLVKNCFDNAGPEPNPEFNPNARDNLGRTPIYFAAMHGHTNVIEILVAVFNHDNDPNRTNRPNQERPTQVAARFLNMPASLRKLEFILAMRHIP